MLRNNNSGYRFLVTMWSGYCPLQPQHLQWIKKYVKVKIFAKEEPLYFEGDGQTSVFLVAKGAIGSVTENEETGGRLILGVALQGMALMTTHHIYSKEATKGDIVCLLSETVVLIVEYRAINKIAEYDTAIGTLLHRLAGREIAQITALRRIALVKRSVQRCQMLAEQLPELFQALHKQDLADLLRVCRRTVQYVSGCIARNPKKTKTPPKNVQ